MIRFPTFSGYRDYVYYRARWFQHFGPLRQADIPVFPYRLDILMHTKYREKK